MNYQPIFYCPDQILIGGVSVTQKDLRLAIKDNDMVVLQPLIDQILIDASLKKTDSVAFDFLLAGIRPIIETAIQREFPTYLEADFPDFFLGALTAIWLKLPQYDSSKSKLSTFVYWQTKTGNRNFTRSSEKFYEACRQFNSNPSMVVQNLAAEYSQTADDYYYEEAGFQQFEDNDLNKRRLEAIVIAMDNLDSRTRSIIQLHLLEDRSPKEVAEIIGPPITEKTVYEYIRRAINKLRLSVEKIYQEREA
jgi:RNA polymerase sigma factor (sigma-70 family)